MAPYRLAPDVLVEPLDDVDSAVFVGARGESHVVDAVGTAVLQRLGGGPTTREELLTLLAECGVTEDATEQYLAALVALWQGAGILDA